MHFSDELCQQVENCVCWTWKGPEKKDCHLKKSISEYKDWPGSYSGEKGSSGR